MIPVISLITEKLLSTTEISNITQSQCSKSIWPLISELNGSISFFGSFISLFPQILETYRDKTVDGLSPLFLIAWVCGDITSLTGALLTKQLFFQVVLAFYFLLNDVFVCGQYYYYGVLHNNSLATIGHEPKPVLSAVASRVSVNGGASAVTANDIEEIIAGGSNNHNYNSAGNIERTTSRGTATSSRSRRDLLIAAVALANTVSGSNAFPLYTQGHARNDDGKLLPPGVPGGSGLLNSEVGVFLSWAGALFYVCARIPQLIKNYQRKSTDGISPFLFATTLLCNITYNISIFTSCRFIDCDDKTAFFNNALPFIIGSAGTVFFDLIYFYQYYILYSNDTKLREMEREIYHEDENSTQEGLQTDLIAGQPQENTPLLH